MRKTQRLFDLLDYVNTKRYFTANDVAQEFDISIRTAHRYLLELDEMGVPLYTEPGRNGGYRVLERRMLPPVIFNEDEALAIFFAFQSLEYYKSLPFDVDIKSASRKLLATLPKDIKEQVERLKSNLIFWTKSREIEAPLLKSIISKLIQKTVVEIKYQSKSKISTRDVYPIGIYADEGLWYMPAFDFEKQEILLFRADRILEISNSQNEYSIPEITLLECLQTYKVKRPVRLYIKLTKKGILLCKNNPYFETDVQYYGDESEGYIDQVIDYADLEFVSDFFLTIGKEAEVVEPVEMRNKILQKAQNIMELYK